MNIVLKFKTQTMVSLLIIGWWTQFTGALRILTAVC